MILSPCLVVQPAPQPHISDHDFERYHLGMLPDEEVSLLEEHYLGCARCAERAQEIADYIDALRGSIILGNYDRIVPRVEP